MSQSHTSIIRDDRVQTGYAKHVFICYLCSPPLGLAACLATRAGQIFWSKVIIHTFPMELNVVKQITIHHESKQTHPNGLATRHLTLHCQIPCINLKVISGSALPFSTPSMGPDSPAASSMAGETIIPMVWTYSPITIPILTYPRKSIRFTAAMRRIVTCSLLELPPKLTRIVILGQR
jgi:hypothetical protein